MANIFERMFYFANKEIKYQKLRHLSPKNYYKFLYHEYKKRVGIEPNFDFPKKYTEKMQYVKIHHNSALKTQLSDKYLVRDWVKEKIGSEYLIPLIDQWDSVDDINFDLLPSKFVLKINSGSGTNIIVKDKSKLNLKKTKMKLRYWMNRDFAFDGDIQLHYLGIKPKILAESFVQDKNGLLNDYKFICFNGEVVYCWVDVGRFEKHYRNIYDLNWNIQPWRYLAYENTPDKLERPKNFDKMIKIAKELCQGFSHVRVDLYNVDGVIYFGEMTFTSESGFGKIIPEEYDYLLGNLWDISD